MSVTIPDYAARPRKRPLAQRVNFRLILIAGIVAMVVGVPIYTLVRQQLNHGIQKVGNASKVDLKAMGNFPFDEVNGTEKDVPAEYRALNGQRVILEGFQYTSNYGGDQVPEFQFVYNIAKCCFGGPPRVQERVFAQVPDGGTAPYYPNLSRIEGILHVRAKREGGRVVSLYDLDVQRVTPID